MDYFIDKDKFIKLYAKIIFENRAAVFLGAGINMEVGLPSWFKLLEDIFEELNLKIEPTSNFDLSLIAQFYINQKGSSKELLNILDKNINLKNCTPGENLQSLVKLPIKQYWTTNYDNLLEKALDSERKDYDLIYNKKQFCNLSKNYSIFKIHGDIIDKNYLVLWKDHYELYEKDRKFFWDKLCMELVHKNFLFIGTSMEDQNLNLILSKINIFLNKEEENKSEHFIFFEDIIEDTDDNKLKKVFMTHKMKDLSQRFNIKTVLLKSYNELKDIFNEINKIILKRNIFISGSAYRYDEFDNNNENSKLFLYNLSNLLCKNNKKILSGFGLGVGDSIISGAIDNIRSENKNIEDYLEIWPFPQQIKTNIKESWTEYRKKIISKSGVVIFVFGNKTSNKEKNIKLANGMWEEFDLAKNANKIVIPIGSTGYMSKKILEHIEENINEFKYLKAYLNTLKKEKNITEIIKIILKILNNTKN